MLSKTTDTFRKIIETASAVFAEQGYAGARMEGIAKAAGINKATLYYQVGDKEALYHAVLERVLGQTAKDIEKELDGIDDSEERLRRFIAIFGRNTGIMRYTAPLMLREMADGGRNIPDALLPFLDRFLSLLDDALAQGIHSGQFRQVDSLMLHMLIVGGLMFYSANEPVRQRIAKMHDRMPDGRFPPTVQPSTQFTDLLLAAIRKPQDTLR